MEKVPRVNLLNQHRPQAMRGDDAGEDGDGDSVNSENLPANFFSVNLAWVTIPVARTDEFGMCGWRLLRLTVLLWTRTEN
jgi:hypothetical protein